MLQLHVQLDSHNPEGSRQEGHDRTIFIFLRCGVKIRGNAQLHQSWEIVTDSLATNRCPIQHSWFKNRLMS